MGPFDGSSSIGNIWRTSNVWPIAATQTALYLTPHLRLEEKIPDLGKLTYDYHPNEVIPTLGGRNLFLESGPKDQRSIESRKDILVFTSDKLLEDVEVTGPISANLFFQTDQKDTDIVLRLCDVYPDGRSILISEGNYRLGVMHCQKEGYQPYLANDIQEVRVDLWATSIVFAKGHAIRLSISSSNYPRLEKNMNVGLLENHTGKSNFASNAVHMGEKYPSRLMLPIVHSIKNLMK